MLNADNAPLPPRRRARRSAEAGMTIIELLAALAIASSLASVAIPKYHAVTEAARVAQAIGDLQAIQTTLDSRDSLPDNLAGVGQNIMDPWGNVYVYVKFPSGAVIDSGNMDTNLCMNCHMGRESTVSVDKLIGDAEPDEQAEGLRFLNPHYFASAATRYGTEAKGAYEYADKEYLGFFDHGDGEAAQCRDCHRTHRLEVKADDCTECHEEVDGPETLKDIRYTLTDFDGDGDDEGGLYYESENMATERVAAIQAYAAETVGTPSA